MKKKNITKGNGIKQRIVDCREGTARKGKKRKKM